ncbi:hypothetical protein N431DRAFT_478802 [Stipitochalara longipes BDJ]|nr:hypothetical protein N431DRAFT_478802 [Stipitochalara longipes BDJ]
MSIGKVSAALNSFQNENTLALLNLNFDFAICKLEAPKEFQGLGASLSSQRRLAAESGTPHRIARKLGALFEEHAPSTPQLISAYGKRVSEISQIKSINPNGGGKLGPFADQVGVDGTAIWAAATSGKSAIPVLMLACMLARIWKGPEATSLWAEIVAQRQDEILKTCDGSKAGDYATLQAMHQDFPRSHLADWDASVRAWLRTADEAKLLDQRQLMLIINNINLSVNNSMNVYRSVLTTWQQAMVSMNNLVQGVPQRIQDGALLLGLSAWHLYPDMIVYSTINKEIKFKDTLVEPGGILTIGLQNNDDHDEGVYWSLPLAYLRYYGDPVQSARSLSQDSLRISMDQLAQVALGSVFHSWREPISEIINLAEWFSDLSDSLHRIASDDSKGVARLSARALLQCSGWLSLLVKAAKSLLASAGLERDTSMRLVAFGMRRCLSFLAIPESYPPPFFGLAHPARLLPMLVNQEERVTALRNVTQRLDVDKEKLIIRYRCEDPMVEFSWYEYASAVPLDAPTEIMSNPDNNTTSPRHRRWLAMKSERELLEPRLEDDSESDNACECIGNCMPSTKYFEGCECEDYYGGCTEECPCFNAQSNTIRVDTESLHETDSTDEQLRICYINKSLDMRLRNVQKRALDISHEDVIIQTLAGFVEKVEGCRQRWIDENLEVGDDIENVQLYSATWEEESPELTVGLECPPWHDLKDQAMSIQRVEAFFGHTTATIYCCDPEDNSEPFSADDIMSSSPAQKFNHEELSKIFSRDALDATLLLEHLKELELQEPFINYFRSLKALAAAAEVYKLLPNATIDLGISTRPIHESLWATSTSKLTSAGGNSLELEAFSEKLDRPRTFACIASFESGSSNIHPSLLAKVMAMSSGNSIFVAAPLICDPIEKPVDHEIRRVIGNIGRAGISMLIPPQDPRIRKLSTERWNLINHLPFNGKLEDSFSDTSMHLSFTTYTQPISVGLHGLQDSEAYYIESVISIHDRDKWVADIDVLQTLESPLFSRHADTRPCSHGIENCNYKGLVSFDNWEELIDREQMSGIVRAKGNWVARLAATAVSVKQGHNTVVLGGLRCWEHVIDATSRAETYIG